MAAQKGRSESVLIKKYGNRRLYDTSQSRYITLDDLAAIVKAGTTVKVVEARTERDLTRQVLTQVILEQQDALDMIPIELLHALIRMRGTLEQAPFSTFLSSVTKQFCQSGHLWNQQISHLFNEFSPPVSENDEEANTSGSSGTDMSDIRKRMDALLGKLGQD